MTKIFADRKKRKFSESHLPRSKIVDSRTNLDKNKIDNNKISLKSRRLDRTRNHPDHHWLAAVRALSHQLRRHTEHGPQAHRCPHGTAACDLTLAKHTIHVVSPHRGLGGRQPAAPCRGRRRAFVARASRVRSVKHFVDHIDSLCTTPRLTADMSYLSPGLDRSSSTRPAGRYMVASRAHGHACHCLSQVYAWKTLCRMVTLLGSAVCRLSRCEASKAPAGRSAPEGQPAQMTCSALGCFRQ